MSYKITRTDIPQVDIQKVNQVISNDYDRLNAKDAVKAIRGLGLDELLIVSMHELRGKQRRSVMRVVLTKIMKNPQALELKEKYQREAQEGFTILLVGQTGVGKSETINTLFGREVAKTNDFTPETKSVTLFEGFYHNVKYRIYDTPGLEEWDVDNLESDKAYLSQMKAQCSSPDVLWYVLRLDDNRVRAADARVLQLIYQNFGEAIWERTMIVFTHADRLSSSEEYQRFFHGRTETLNKAIARVTDGKIREVPTVAVANGHECTPDGERWLGELFTTSFERLNPERLNAFLLAFAKDLEIPKPQPPEIKADVDEEVIEKTETEEKRIVLTEAQMERVEEKSADASMILARTLIGVEIGAAIDAATGGATLGIPTIVGAVIGGIVGLLDWLWD